MNSVDTKSTYILTYSDYTLSDDPEDNSYINKMPLPKVRVWIRYRARAIAGVKGNFRHSHVNIAAHVIAGSI